MSSRGIYSTGIQLSPPVKERLRNIKKALGATWEETVVSLMDFFETYVTKVQDKDFVAIDLAALENSIDKASSTREHRKTLAFLLNVLEQEAKKITDVNKLAPIVEKIAKINQIYSDLGEEKESEIMNLIEKVKIDRKNILNNILPGFDESKGEMAD